MEQQTQMAMVIQNAEQLVQGLPVRYEQIVLAQLSMMRLLENPVLLNDVTDTVLSRLEQVMKNPDSDFELRVFQKHCATAIQNLLFFTRAIMLYKLKKNRNEARELLKDAGIKPGTSVKC